MNVWVDVPFTLTGYKFLSAALLLCRNQSGTVRAERRGKKGRKNMRKKKIKEEMMQMLLSYNTISALLLCSVFVFRARVRPLLAYARCASRIIKYTM